MKLSNTTRLFIGLVALSSLGVIAFGVETRQAFSWDRFLVILAAVLVAARFKVSLPKLNSSMSVTLPFILIALTQLSFLETLIVTVGSVVMQSVGNGQKKPQPIQLLFNCSNVANAIGLAYFVVHHMSVQPGLAGSIMAIAAAGTVYFLANTVPVAVVISLAEGKNVLTIWQNVFLLSFPITL